MIDINPGHDRIRNIKSNIIGTGTISASKIQDTFSGLNISDKKIVILDMTVFRMDTVTISY